MKRILLFLITIFVFIMHIGLQGQDYNSIRIKCVPNDIIEKMDSFVVSKTGNEIFVKYLVFDSLKSGYFSGDSTYPPHYESQKFINHPHIKIVYNFIIPDKPWRNITFSWSTDTLGNFIKGNLPFGIPNCIENPMNCKFNIDSLQAIEISKKAGLPKSLSQIIASFSINYHFTKFIWEVRSVIESGKNGWRRSVYFVDINSGEILGKGIEEAIQ